VDTREGLRFHFENTAQWRREKAKEYPENERNLQAAEWLDELAASVDNIPDELLCNYEALECEKAGEELSEILSGVGFRTAYENAAHFLKRYLRRLDLLAGFRTVQGCRTLH
jgi:hypothetical protein